MTEQEKENSNQLVEVAIIFGITIIALALIANHFMLGNEEVEYTGNASEFTLTDTEGNTFSLSDYQGEIVVLDLMGTLCPPCQQEVLHLKEVKENFGNEVKILSISVAAYDTNQTLSSFKEEENCDWRFAIDTDNVIKKYNVQAIPKIVIIGKNGNVKFTHTGLTYSSTLIENINGFI
ncbi:MAG: TlpA family protein disulfide reductase [Hadesarchaea archaeon]|nr:TlpA family protein disulfide reductase [Hadesarchaea archaeon]